MLKGLVFVAAVIAALAYYLRQGLRFRRISQQMVRTGVVPKDFIAPNRPSDDIHVSPRKAWLYHSFNTLTIGAVVVLGLLFAVLLLSGYFAHWFE
jgi:hypothetical protein